MILRVEPKPPGISHPTNCRACLERWHSAPVDQTIRQKLYPIPGVLPQCGVNVEKVPQLPSKGPFSKRFEEAVGLACESASVRRVARQFRLADSTVRAIDLP